MKKFLTIMLIAVAAMATSCTDLLEIDESYDGEVRITSGISTRVIGTMWEANDAIGVYMNLIDGTLGTLGANVEYVTATGDGNFTSTDPLYYPVSGYVNFLAYYPYVDDATFDATAYSVNVASQTDLPAIDLMTASATEVAKSASAVNLTFKHKLSNIVITVTPGDDWTTADLAGLTVKLVGTDTQAAYNLETNAITLGGSVADITLNTTADGTSAEGIVIPQTLTDAILSITTLSGIYELVIPTAAFVSGYQYVYDVTIDATGATFTNSTDGTWDDDDDIVAADAVYILGEATVYQSLTDNGVEAAAMAVGINEVDGTYRNGMYEKYMLLEGGKEFQIVIKEGVTETAYGADLVNVELDGSDDQPAITVQKGVMTRNATLTVPEDGLYHIVLDLNTNGDLSDQPIVIAPVTWGVRGGMNSWGFTDGTATAFNKTTMTFTWTEQSLAANGEFKFAYGGGWKIQLDDEGMVKASTNLGVDMMPNGYNLSVTDAGKYTITLTYTLAAGTIADNYSYTTELTEANTTPTTMYMIGTDFGYWDWSSEEIVDMVPVNGVAGAFWTIQYFTAENGFKFCLNREWNGDFTNLEGEYTGYTVADGNCFVDADGIYMVYIDYVEGNIAIEPAAVYGIGDAFADATWTENSADNLFTANGKTLAATVVTTTTTGMYSGLRMYAASSIATSDWWTREFNIFDGVVVFRGTDGDQEAVSVTAGQTVTLDFSVPNAATGSIN